MKRHWGYLRHLIFILSLVATSFSFPLEGIAQTDTSLDQQKADCAKDSASEWSSTKNRCVGKVEATNTRNAVEDCASITDINQRAECHKKIAESKTGLNSNPDSLPDGNTSGSAIMNGAALAASAYAIIGMINGLGSGNINSTCTSKKIFAVTALAGTATDIWLKIQARKKLDALKNKYQIDVKNNAYDAQIKAFQYLKEEQQTVKDIASQEKKRNMLLMLGYGAASVMAIYEMATYGTNPGCYKKEVAGPVNADAQAADATPKESTPSKNDVQTEKAAAAPELDPNNGISGEETTPAATDTAKSTTKVVATPANLQATPTPANMDASNYAAPKDQYLVTQKNGVSQIKSVDGSKSIVGNKIIDKLGNVVDTVDSNKIDISKFGSETPIATSDYNKYGVYQSGATNSASQIKFINSSTGARTSVNGTTTIINDGKKR